MAETADVVIIGGGVMGASIAFYLAQRRGCTGTYDVCLGERDPDLHYFRYARFAEGDLIRPAYEYSVLG